MAEECSVYELEGFKKELDKLLDSYSSDELRRDSKAFCSAFCKLVEGYTCRWQVPLPQIRVLQIALCYFVQASSSFTSACDHVHYTLSSVALSVFELLLFFDQKDFHRDPVKLFSDTFQECHLSLERYQNVHMLQVTHVVQYGGPWGNSTLQAILSDSQIPQNEVDRYISSELPVFFELRVHYLLACERVSEAMALAKRCVRHPTAGQHPFFLQVYLTWLCKTSQYEHLHKETAGLSGKDAVHIICSIETKEKDEILLALSKAFLSHQLCRGDMYYLWDLVFVWSKLHWRVNPSKKTLLEESHQLMLSATNVKSIFPFIRVILAELGEEGLQFCLELCANALQSCLPCDVVTKSLIYKTIANLLPNDLEVCRACALLVFFLERTVEAYKMVFLLYTHPDQDYLSETSPIGNHVRFEILQILKKGLYFDPEFWNLIALRTNCLKLMSEKVVSAALEEIMEEKWVPNYCTKESTLRFNTYPTNCQQETKATHQAGAKKRHQKEDGNHVAAKRVKMRLVKAQPNADHTVKKKGKQGGSQTVKETSSSESFRRSFWQAEKTQENFTQQFGYGECRRITRLSEQKLPKRKIRKPRWLLEDSGTLENNIPPKVKKHKMKPQHQKQNRPSMLKSCASGAVKNNGKHTTSINSHLSARENETKCQKRHSIDSLRSSSPTEIILELSQPDNELMGAFSEDDSNRPRAHTQMLLYRPTVKPLVHPQPVKAVHRNEVILRARDPSTFVQQLHCYGRRQKGKGVVSNVQVSFSTITRSSVQGSPPKVSPGILCEKPVVEMKVTFASQTPTASTVAQSPVKAVVSQTLTATEISQVPPGDQVSESTSPAMVSPNPNAAKISQPPDTDISQIPTSATISLSPNEAKTSNDPARVEMTPQSQDVVGSKAARRTNKSLPDGDVQQTGKSLSSASENDKSPIPTSAEVSVSQSEAETSNVQAEVEITHQSQHVVTTAPRPDECLPDRNVQQTCKSLSSASENDKSPTDTSIANVAVIVTKEPMDSDVPDVMEELEIAKICSVSESTFNEVSAKDLEHVPSTSEVKENPADVDAEINAQKEAVLDETTVTNGKTSEAEATCVPKEHGEEPANDEDSCAQAPPTELVAVPDETTVTNGKTSEAEATCVPKEKGEDATCAQAPPTELVTERTLGTVGRITVDLKVPIKEDGTSVDVTPAQGSAYGGVTPVLENMSTAPCKVMPTHSSPSTGQDASATSVHQAKRGVETVPQEDTRDIAVKKSGAIGTAQESGYTQNTAGATPENNDPGGAPQESEESKLKYCCTICHKMFRGKCVVAHAMFHYSKDECMFCGTLFNDNLLAMMHLSEHIEKLKKSDESPGPRNKTPGNRVSESHVANQTSAEIETSSPLRRRGRQRKSVVNSKPMNPPESSPCDDKRKLRSNPPESSPRDNRKLRSSPPESSPPDDNRKLRSNSTQVDNHILHENRLNASQPCSSKTPVHKVNGHIGRRRLSLEKAKQDTLNVEEKQATKLVKEISYPSDGAKEISLAETSALRGASTRTLVQGGDSCSSSSVDKMVKTKPGEALVPKAVANREEPAAIEDAIETQEKVCCPVDGCVWNADLSKNRIALLYHALEDHHGDIKPLELAFRVGNSRCGVCMRVLWSFQHYQDHVERHRLTPRHPCLHQGCGARFKTGIEMRRHTRKHSPLQAPCSLPGCSQLFICLWALNLHEREHYATTPTKTKTVKKMHEAQVVGEQDGCMPKEASVSPPDSTVNKSSKAVEKLRGKQTVDNLSTDREATPRVNATTGLVKKRLKDKYNLKDSNGTKNRSVLPDKDTSTSATTIIDRLRQMLSTKTKHPSVHKVSTAALAVTNDNMRNRLNNTEDNRTVQVPKRRGRPPGSTKLKKMLSRMKAIADQKADLKDEPVQGTPNPLPPSLLEKTQASPVSNEISTRQRREKLTDTSSTAELIDKSKTPIKKKIINQCVNEESDAVDDPPKPPVKAANRLIEISLPPTSTAEETLKLTDEEELKKSCVSKELHISEDKGTPTAPSSSSKVKKKMEAANTSETKKAKRGRPRKNPGLLNPPGKPAESETLAKVQLVAEDREVVESHIGDMGKLKPMEETIDSIIGSPAPSNSSKATNNQKAMKTPEKRLVKKGRPIKNPGLAQPSGKPTKSEVPDKVQPVAGSHVADVNKEKPMEETLDPTVVSPAPSNSSKAKNKREAINTPEKKKNVKKGRPIKNPGLSKPSGKPAKSEVPDKVQPVTGSHVADAKIEKPTEEMLDPTVGSPAPSDSSKVNTSLKATHIPENKKVVERVCLSTNQGGMPAKSETLVKVQPASGDGKVEESHVADMGKERQVEEMLLSTVGSPAPSNPTKIKKKRKATNTLENKMVKKVRPSKNTGLSRPSGKPGKSKTPAKVQPVTVDRQESQVGDITKTQPMEQTLDSIAGSPAPSNVTKLKKIRKATDALENKTDKKVCPSEKTGPSEPSEPPAQVQESHAGDVEKANEVKLNSAIGSPGYSRLVNGYVVPNNEPQKDDVSASDKAEKAKATPVVTSLAYGKRPFIRPPPTAYLDERYTNMPKRRKEVSMFNHSLQDLRWPAQQAIAVIPLQRQRCANCFITFGSAEELQAHLSLKKCSNLFGFDSDDENNF